MENLIDRTVEVLKANRHDTSMNPALLNAGLRYTIRITNSDEVDTNDGTSHPVAPNWEAIFTDNAGKIISIKAL